ncbi:MAG: quinoprotein relay system zinc metallohydrolase 1 [Proteobacteria bacterium]|nr:quinoprotein relay system zinc metallohydrolase 1 [Pseudomonadota bacterium]
MLRTLAIAMLLVALCGLAPAVFAQAALDYRLQARAVAPDVYVVEGAQADFAPANGCNIINTGFIVTGAGVVVVDTGPSKRYGEQLRVLIERTTREAIVRVVHLNLHPDYFLGSQAFADVPRYATAITRAGMRREAAAYEDNLYRLCGDWMKGTEALLPDHDAVPGSERIGRHELEWRELSGHTASDLVLIDRTAGVTFAGGLVFSARIPTTPHAELPAWQQSLAWLAAHRTAVVVPSHGSLAVADAAIDGTQRYLAWIDGAFRRAAEQGLDMNDVLRLPVPAEFRQWAAFDTEYVRNVAHLYPRYEQAALNSR